MHSHGKKALLEAWKRKIAEMTSLGTAFPCVTTYFYPLILHRIWIVQINKLCGRPPQYAPAQACKLTFDLLTLKVVSESRVTWATSVPILVFLGLSVLDLGPMYATDRQTDVRQTDRQTDVRCTSSLNAPWTGHNKREGKTIQE